MLVLNVSVSIILQDNIMADKYAQTLGCQYLLPNDGWYDVFLVLSGYSSVCHIVSKSSLLVSQIQYRGAQPELGNLPPDKLPVLGVDDAQPHQGVLIHPDQAPPSNLLLQETLTV